MEIKGGETERVGNNNLPYFPVSQQTTTTTTNSIWNNLRLLPFSQHYYYIPKSEELGPCFVGHGYYTMDSSFIFGAGCQNLIGKLTYYLNL